MISIHPYTSINPHIYIQLIFDKDVKAIQWKKIVVLTNGAGTIEHLYANKTKENTNLNVTSYTKINSNHRTESKM